MKLYHYSRSSASYRVRIALHYKALEYTQVPVHLLNHGGEQHFAEYRAINPQELTPTLQIDHNYLGQSLAIIEYLEERYPTPPLLPKDLSIRARLRALAQAIACDIHPLNNLRVLNYLTNTLNVTEAQKLQWYHHWLQLGFGALETQLQQLPRTQDVCYGNTPTIADVCLIPQVYNAKRFDFSLDPYPVTKRIYDYCVNLPAFIQASPENNP